MIVAVGPYWLSILAYYYDVSLISRGISIWDMLEKEYYAKKVLRKDAIHLEFKEKEDLVAFILKFAKE
jgi:hypothetical protein